MRCDCGRRGRVPNENLRLCGMLCRRWRIQEKMQGLRHCFVSKTEVGAHGGRKVLCVAKRLEEVVVVPWSSLKNERDLRLDGRTPPNNGTVRIAANHRTTPLEIYSLPQGIEVKIGQCAILYCTSMHLYVYSWRRKYSSCSKRLVLYPWLPATGRFSPRRKQSC